MHILKPIRYRITFNPEKITGVKGPNGETEFSAPVTKSSPKLYVILHNHEPVYVGATIQSIGARLRSKSKYNYEWRRCLENADVDIWLLENEKSNGTTTMETVEAEVVFLFRKISGQWPKYQTEIHFHHSNYHHRTAAQYIINHYGIGAHNAEPSN